MEKMKVVKLFEVKTGVNQQSGKPWKAREVKLEAVQNAMHPDQFVARLFGEAVDKFTAEEGAVIGVSLYHRVNEWKGNFYNEVSVVDFDIN